MEPLGQGAIRRRHLSDLRQQIAFPARSVLPGARFRLQLFGALLHRGFFLCCESLGLLRFLLWAHRNHLVVGGEDLGWRVRHDSFCRDVCDLQVSDSRREAATVVALIRKEPWHVCTTHLRILRFVLKKKPKSSRGAKSALPYRPAC